MAQTEVTPEDINALVEQIRPLLAQRDPTLVGGALADLTAILLAGHIVEDDQGEIDRAATDGFRETLIGIHVTAVRKLIPVNEAVILEQKREPAVMS